MKKILIYSYVKDKDFVISDYKDIIFDFNNIILKLKEKIILAYIKKPLVRYIYGKQFNYLFKFFNKKYAKIDYLLKYITNDLYSRPIDYTNVKEEGDIIENNINHFEEYLKNLLEKNNLSLRKIYEKTIIKENINDEKYQGIYIYCCMELEKEMFQIFRYLTGNTPIAQNILICNKEITKEEITSFLYRAILCEFNSCFIISRIELLDIEQKLYFIELLNKFFPKGDEKINSCIIIFSSNKTSDIYKNLFGQKYKKILNLKRNLFESLKYEENNIEIIKSDREGVGKSTQIKKEIQEKGKNYIYFPVGGVISREEIMNRLKGLNFDENCSLHLDLYNTDQTSLMKELLFSILITRFYGRSEDIFYLSKNIEIKVEIPNDFIDYLSKFPILTLFKIKETFNSS